MARHTKNTKRGTVTLRCETVVLVWFQVTNLEHAFELSFRDSQKRGLQAIFDSSQDGLVSLEAPWYLPSFCDLDGEDIVATKGVGPLKGCGVVFSDLFFLGVETTKSRYTLEKNIEMQTWKLDPWIHGRPSIRKSCS